jgi:hypothetical protein
MFRRGRCPAGCSAARDAYFRAAGLNSQASVFSSVRGT